MVPVPRTLDELTPAALTVALAGRCPGAVVAEARLGPVADGTNRRTSVRLTYARGTGPGTVFVKLSGRLAHRLALAALGAVAAEARLAASGVDLPIDHPAPFAAGVDLRRLAAVVVTEDVAELGGRPNAATSPLGVDEVAHGLEGLARLHGAFADRPLPPGLAFLRPWRLGRRWAPVSAASLWRGLRRLDRAASRGGAAPGGGAGAGGFDPLALERQFRSSAVLAAAGPQTVLHGDPHPGNTYGLVGDRTGFYDWQLVRTGHFSHDVGYFVISSLAVEDRRAHERALLRHYLEALRAAWAGAPGIDESFDRYRAQPAFGLATWLHTLAAGSFQPHEVCTATIARFRAAYDDLETRRSIVAGRP